MGRHSRQKININLSPTLNFSPFCDACPPSCPSSPSSCTDRLCLSLLTAAKGQRSQPVTDSLSTWQSRQIQLEWNYCLHCSVCNRTSVARFPIDNIFLFPFPMAIVPAPNKYPSWHPLEKQKKKSFSAAALFLPFPPLCLFPFLLPHILWDGQGQLLFLLVLSAQVLVALSGLTAGQIHSEFTL